MDFWLNVAPEISSLPESLADVQFFVNSLEPGGRVSSILYKQNSCIFPFSVLLDKGDEGLNCIPLVIVAELVKLA